MCKVELDQYKDEHFTIYVLAGGAGEPGGLRVLWDWLESQSK